MKTLGSVAAVAAAAQDDADAEVQDLERQAEARVRVVLREAEVPPAPAPDREHRLRAARRAAVERLAREDWEDRRELLEQRDAWLRSVVETALERLRQPAEPARRKAELAQLAAEALRHLPGAAFEVVVAAPDEAALLDESWRRALAAGRPGAEVRVVPSADLKGGGCLVRTADGRAAFDNTYEARARRLETELRAELGPLYES
jgi:vacuolar-type H+-ATPase subunit E/Vma4